MCFDLSTLGRNGDSFALLTADGQTVSYADLVDRAEEFLRRLGSSRQLVAIEAASEVAPIVAHVAALSAGHVVMPLPREDDAARISLEDRFRPDVTYRRVAGRWQLIRHGRQKASPLHPDLALLLQTSGSTGQGKGVRLSGTAVRSNAEAISVSLRISPTDRAALVLPLHYSYGLSVLHSHLLAGASVWLHPHSVLSDSFLQHLDESGCTSLAGVPHTFELLESVGFAEAMPKGLNLLTVAGGAMRPDRVASHAAMMDARGGRFVVMYGQTEATARIAILPPDLAETHPDAVGYAIPGGKLDLRAPDGTDLTAPEAEGELIYRGPNVMMGYADDRADLGRTPELDELPTGDLARRDGDGIYRITGRRSRMSKIAGLRIGHDALERSLASDGLDVAVWGDDGRIEVAAAARTGDAFDADHFLDKASEKAGIGRSHIRLHRLDALPRRANGKIDYAALRQLKEAPHPHTDLITAFGTAFSPRPVSPNDSFVSLGGDSLRHVELTLALQERLGSVRPGWEGKAIRELEKSRPDPQSQLSSDLVIRVLAILAVVTTHQTGWAVYGGAAAMVILLGISVGKFRRAALARADFGTFFAPMLRVLLPYYLVLAGYAFAWGEVPWVSVALLGNFALTTPESHQMLPFLYWFIEAYVQISLLIALPFLWHAPRRWIEKHAFLFGLGILAFAIVLRVTVPEIWPMQGRALFTVPWVLYLFAIGWCISTVRTRRDRLLLFALCCLIMPLAAWIGGNWYGSWQKYMSLLAVTAVLIFVPQIRLPRLALRPIAVLGGAAFHIYLLHRLVPEALFPLFGLEGSSTALDASAIAGGVALGLAAAGLQKRLITAAPLNPQIFRPLRLRRSGNLRQ